MRLLFYDSVNALAKGKSIRGVKSFASSEEYLRRHFGKKALVPGVVHIEAMAQLVGWLVMHAHDFRVSAIMSLLEGVVVPPRLKPGVTVEIRGEIISTSSKDSLGRASMSLDGETIATMDRIIYSHVRAVDPAGLVDLFCYYSGLDRAVVQGRKQLDGSRP